MNCGEEILRKDLEEHLKECPEVESKCETCGLKYKPNQQGDEKHDCLEELMKQCSLN